jgi:hypothetical protein
MSSEIVPRALLGIDVHLILDKFDDSPRARSRMAHVIRIESLGDGRK